MGDTVPDTEAQAHLDHLMPIYRNYLQSDQPTQEWHVIEPSRVDGMEFSLAEGIRERSSLHGQQRAR